jgi:hypothetical protein
MTETSRPKFRISLWFLKGEQDAKAADEAAQSGDALALDAADLLPIEDRYLDDGSHRKTLTHMFTLRTGRTDYMETLHHVPGGTTLNTKAIIGDLKSGGRRVAAAIGAAALAIGALVAFYVF